MGCDATRQIACGQEGLVGQTMDMQTGSSGGRTHSSEQRYGYRPKAMRETHDTRTRTKRTKHMHGGSRHARFGETEGYGTVNRAG